MHKCVLFFFSRLRVFSHKSFFFFNSPQRKRANNISICKSNNFLCLKTQFSTEKTHSHKVDVRNSVFPVIFQQIKNSRSFAIEPNSFQVFSFAKGKVDLFSKFRGSEICVCCLVLFVILLTCDRGNYAKFEDVSMCAIEQIKKQTSSRMHMKLIQWHIC